MAVDPDSLPPDSLELEVERAGALPPTERAAAIAALCAAHPDHAPEIRMMLALRGLDETPPASRPPAPPARIGAYTLERLLGEGGMGTVWLASQEEPVRRRVAVKLVKPGIDSDKIVKRFEAERQAIALMEHSSIARVFDGGLTDDGRPYFVMEYVDGEPITTFCRREALDLDTRLELVEQVCAGVAHAHQRGIIHRDLKPSNILVTRENGAPRAKIIDFGLARAIEGEQLANTMLTLHGQVIGTPAYMSPEQATLDADHIDTRTDVYALGVVLYELLTGELPFRFDDSKFDLAAIQRRICDEDPVRPSTKVASRPHPAPPRPHWVRRLRGELDWIVMRALEKAPDRRYGSASALAADIRRYLDDFPVEARPPSKFYQLKKFAHRNRGLVGGVVVAALALIAGTTTSVVFAIRAIADRDAAETAGREADRARDDAEAVARFQAEALGGMNVREIGELIATQLGEDLRKSDRFADDPDGVAKVEAILAAINPSNLARRALDQSLLRTAVDAIDEQFADRPIVAARLYSSFGQTYTSLALADRALTCYRRAFELLRDHLGESHRDTVTAMGDLGFALMEAQEPTAAEPFLEQAYAIRKADLPRHPEFVAEAALQLSALRIQQQDLERAEARAREAATRYGGIGQKAHRARANCQLADVLRRRGRAADSVTVLEAAVADAREAFGERSETTLMLLNNLALALLQCGREQESVDRFRELLPLVAAEFGDDDVRTIRGMLTLSGALVETGRQDEGKVLVEEALTRLRRIRPATDPLLLQATKRLAEIEAK
ncbi:MAG: serine/threonine-protein kinase [Planctomycetota bacterium]